MESKLVQSTVKSGSFVTVTISGPTLDVEKQVKIYLKEFPANAYMTTIELEKFVDDTNGCVKLVKIRRRHSCD